MQFLLKKFIIFEGFERPSAIQQRAIIPVVKGRDVIAQYVYFERHSMVDFQVPFIQVSIAVVLVIRKNSENMGNVGYMHLIYVNIFCERQLVRNQDSRV